MSSMDYIKQYVQHMHIYESNVKARDDELTYALIAQKFIKLHSESIAE